MQPAGLVTLTMRELDRLKVIQAVVDTGLKPGRAAERQALTTRRIRRFVGRPREHGKPDAIDVETPGEGR
ncbi:hypothetical protein CFB40_09455 [Burkholderia sp. AU31652]|uniref:hypothetical protein n=1 Tax=Burkholderia sp. AU31652 TaxID=2015354 RepID=UPI000B7AD14B|nr:hypothetical protein CFB40_09455 [Burkholderia sp. AU31652]